MGNDPRRCLPLPWPADIPAAPRAGSCDAVVGIAAAAAVDGHRQRHARQLLGRRPLLRSPGGRCARAATGGGRGGPAGHWRRKHASLLRSGRRAGGTAARGARCGPAGRADAAFRSRSTRPKPPSPARPWPPAPRSSTTSPRSAGDPEMTAAGDRVAGRPVRDAHARDAADDAGRPALRRRRDRGPGVSAAPARCAAGRGHLRERLALDPGVGFGKTHQHNLTLLAGCRRLHELRQPLLVGASRKAFIAKVIGDKEADRTARHDRRRPVARPPRRADPPRARRGRSPPGAIDCSKDRRGAINRRLRQPVRGETQAQRRSLRPVRGMYRRPMAAARRRRKCPAIAGAVPAAIGRVRPCPTAGIPAPGSITLFLANPLAAAFAASRPCSALIRSTRLSLPGAFVMSKIVASLAAMAVCCVSFAAQVQGAEKVGPAHRFQNEEHQGRRRSTSPSTRAKSS